MPLATTGCNPYESLRAALTQLGFTTTTAKDYEKQFGISLQARNPVAIQPSPSHLLADQLVLSDALAPFASQIQSEFQINLEDLDMWLIEPPTPAQEAPIYIAAKANTSKPQKKERILGLCEKIIYGRESVGLINIGAANYYMGRYENKPDFFGDGSATTVTIVQQPAHGELKFWAAGKMENGLYSMARAIPAVPLDSTNKVFNAKGLLIQYTPESGYFGNDSYVVQFEQDGVKVKVKRFFVIDSRGDLEVIDCEIAPGKYNKNFEYKKDFDAWKISLLPSQTTEDLDS